MKLRTFVLVSLSSFALFVLTCRFSWTQADPISEEALAGKEVWQSNNCVSCHTLLGHGGYVGGDLTYVLSKRSPQRLTDFFKDPPLIPPHEKETHPHLSEEETKAIFAYFEYMGNIPTLGWPPESKMFEGGDVQ